MSKLWLVAVHEYKRIVFKKSFILTLLSVPLMITAGVGTGLTLERFKHKRSDLPAAFVDLANVIPDEPSPPPVDGDKTPVQFIRFSTEDDARAALDAKKIQAFFVIEADYVETRRVSLIFLEQPGRATTRNFYAFLQYNLLAGYPPEIAHRAALLGDKVIIRSVSGQRELPAGGPTFGMIMPLFISLGFLMLLVMSSGYLMSAVADEKENRTMEVLTTSISSTQLMGGKVVGIVGVTFTQLGLWSLVTTLGIMAAHYSGIEWFQNLELDWGTVGATVAIAIPTFIIASALMIAVGATVPSSQEGQALAVLFLMLHTLPPVFIMHSLVRTPQAFLPTLLSVLPFTALFTVSLRTIFMVVPAWQIATSVALQAVCAVGAIWLAGRAFRMGMLNYGRKLRWRQLFRRRPR